MSLNLSILRNAGKKQQKQNKSKQKEMYQDISTSVQTEIPNK